MRLVYSWLIYLISPYLLFRLWWKGRHAPLYRQRIAERFSYGVQAKQPMDIWLHAVSLGEVIAATPLIKALIAQDKKLLITTMTPTGAERVRINFGEQVVHRYLPYELPGALCRFYRAFKPKIGIIFETELWPNMIHYAYQAQIPVFLFNARLSEKSFQGYKWLSWIIRPLLQKYSGIYTQTKDDAIRFEALGANKKDIQVLGNIKFDLQLSQMLNKPILDLKTRCGEQRPILILASTHADEEKQILSCLPHLQEKIPGILILIAPRHPERFQKVFQLAVTMNFNTGLRSQLEALTEKNQVVIIDSLGELISCYHISDYAFLGGSLIPVGGHNMLEAIAMDVPVLSGKYVQNFKAICHDLLASKAMIMVNNAEELTNAIVNLHANQTKRKVLIDNARSVLNSNKGALARYVTQTNLALNN